MKVLDQAYRKNFSLIILFIILISVSLIFGLTLAYNLTSKYVENEFSSKKIDVLDQTIKPYDTFFQKSINEISFYQGYLDSTQAGQYAAGVIDKYPFVKRIVFYDTEISNRPISDGFKVEGFSIEPKAVYLFGKNVPTDSLVLFSKERPTGKSFSLKTADEFNKIAIKLSGYVESSDTSRALTSDEIFSTFYNITPNRITYMNIPRREELKVYKELMFGSSSPSPVYQQDMVSFQLDAASLKINNAHPELYHEISIRPLVYEPIDNTNKLVTDIPLPGPFAEHKLYFSSPRDYLRGEINSRFLPVGASLLGIYTVLVLIAYLIYRNMNINSRMFKLQYDFINNLTHEFKTPVSVIKIAGNNIRSASKLSDPERMHYGKILDEEADKLNDLMNKLLSFTQIENKSIQLKEESINLEVFTQDIIDSYQIKYPHFNIEYQIDYVTHFTTDPVLLASIFQNLIDNAYKYSLPEHRDLKIVIKKVKKTLEFRFIDKGIGIPENEIENVFKKFYRIQSLYNQQGSVGLGLAFCKELVNFMNGTLTVKSVLGKGSEFKIVLPYEN